MTDLEKRLEYAEEQVKELRDYNSALMIYIESISPKIHRFLEVFKECSGECFDIHITSIDVMKTKKYDVIFTTSFDFDKYFGKFTSKFTEIMDKYGYIVEYITRDMQHPTYFTANIRVK